MRKTLLALLTSVLVGPLLAVLTAPSAYAGCVTTVPALTATAAGSSTLYCSHIKHKENDQGWFDVRCVHTNFSERVRLYPAQTTKDTYGCQKGFNYVWVMYGTQVWCRDLGVKEPYTHFWNSGSYAWNTTRSLNCKVIFVNVG